jgi:hypothetical protein
LDLTPLRSRDDTSAITKRERFVTPQTYPVHVRYSAFIGSGRRGHWILRVFYEHVT